MAAPGRLPEPSAVGLSVFALVFGIAVWGFAMLWLAIAAAVTVRAARAHLPFNLTWWGFTFPVGTCVTGSAALAARSGADLFAWAAVGLYALLVAAWAVVTARTAHGILSGRLF